MKQRPKMARVVYRNPHFNCGVKAFAGTREKALSQDEEHRPYVRGSRRYPNLPDGWDDTKWLKRYKSWKHRARKRKQWMKHWMHPSEWGFIRGFSNWWRMNHIYPGRD